MKRVFDSPEPPWKGTEGGIVSTLVSSIARSFSRSVAIEELRVVKPGKQSNSLATKSTDHGRCDLWVSIPELEKDGKPFAFYLEAKISRFDWPQDKLEEHLRSSIGISKIFRDFQKSRPGKLDQRSPYRNTVKPGNRHFIIGLLVTPLSKTILDANEIIPILGKVFEKSGRLHLGEAKGAAPKGKKMSRYPSVALMFFDLQQEYPGMLATFTVLGSN